jgi:hypothetical protein
MKPRCGHGSARVVRAALAHRKGDDGRAVVELERAIEDFDHHGLGLWAQSARLRLGTLTGGEEGRSLVSGFKDWAAGQGIKNPEAMAAVNAPGFAE